ncbi:MAG: isoleucine--tRNA ligase [Flavobacteriales bacterium]
MANRYTESKGLNLPAIADEVSTYWKKENVFERSISEREGHPAFVFYEGPPSANGMPGIHHVMGRTIKDIFCRYNTLKGKQVKRKAGWDTHGLPIELAVEKTLGIKKEDIGTKISVEEYNTACRNEVMKYTDKWEELTRIMGYWVDMNDPYITYDNKYIESVWWLLAQIYKKGLLYKGFTIQPFSPAAGTGLSSHELNQPGTYKNVKDTTIVAQFEVKEIEKLNELGLLKNNEGNTYFLAWTTTPWTLPSNTALAVGKNISYVAVNTYNQYTHLPITVILAKDLVGKYFSEKNAELRLEDYKAGDKQIPFELIGEVKGEDLQGIRYHQLMPYAQPSDGDAFRVVIGDFVTTEDGTGIVHIAPSFGADDFKTAKQNGIGSLTLVDRTGRFASEVNDTQFPLQGRFVKEAYFSDEEKAAELQVQKEVLKPIIPALDKFMAVDDIIALKLKLENKAFKIEKYEHNYPHCWRTDKPILYYPLDSWFVKVTEVKQRMVELNNTINWKPEATGTGRFGNWLENANDWNLSRSRFWGIPLPIWRTEDGSEEICIESIEQLKMELDKSVKAGFISENPLAKFEPNERSVGNYETFDLHKPYVDDFVLVSSTGTKMVRESDLIDVWFDSGAMPYAQLHYPFENKELIDNHKNFPADFIAEGVDQTRGWFYTLHAIATMCFDSVAYRNVVSNGLVLDKNGNKMSKRLGNAIDPFTTIGKYGPDATRWYMITNAQPWDNLKFDLEGIAEVQRKFFGTLFNTYGFFAIYANIDNYSYDNNTATPLAQRGELDRWIISRLNSLIAEVTASLDDFNPTPAARAIDEFVDELLSNWYVRLSRKRFWHGEMTADKKSAFDTLFECLAGVSQLMSPFAPFFSDWLYKNLHGEQASSVHLSLLPLANVQAIDADLESRMDMARKISSMVLSIRKKENLRVRQPLAAIRIPVLDDQMKSRIDAVRDLILTEVNVKQIEFVDESQAKIVKQLKLNFKTLGKKCGKHMKDLQAFAGANGEEIIRAIESANLFVYTTPEGEIELTSEDVEIIPVDIPGWKVANDGPLTVALDITLSDELRAEGIAREFVNRIQNIRKESGLEVTDKISVKILANEAFNAAIESNSEYIRAQVLAGELIVLENLIEGQLVEIDEGLSSKIYIQKI